MSGEKTSRGGIFPLLVGFILVTWSLEIVDLIPGINLDAYGIRPRTFEGLWGIFTAPFLHGGFDHLISNTLSFCIFGVILMFTQRSAARFISLSVFIALIAGLAVWGVGATNSNHIGASAVIFGYFGFLVFDGVFRRELKEILAALIVGIGYGSLIFGVLPGQPGISWEGHLFGFLSGIFAAYVFSRMDKKAEQRSLSQFR